MTTIQTTTITGIGLGSQLTTATLDVIQNVTVTRSDWTGFSHNTTSTMSSALSGHPSSAITSAGMPCGSRQIRGRFLLTALLRCRYSSDRPGDGSVDRPASKAWIAGPVVGAIFAVVVVALLIVVWLRRRQRKLSGGRTELEGDSGWRSGDKPELHSDSLQPYKAAGSHTQPSELPANEPAAQELPGLHELAH